MAKAKAVKSEKLAFQVHGDFITDLARNLWTEGTPEKGLNILLKGYHGMTEEIAMKIVTGKLKLVGVNETTHAEEDNSTHAPNGLPLLSMIEMLKGSRKKEEKLDEQLKDLIYPRHCMASPWGGVLVPQSIAKKIKLGEDSFDKYDEYTFEKRTDAYHRWEEMNRIRNKYPNSRENIDPRKFELLTEELELSDEDIEDAEYFDNTQRTLTTQDIAMEHALSLANSMGVDKANIFLEARNRFLAARDENEGPPDADPSLFSCFAWVDRDGNFFPCEGYAGHIALAQRFNKTEGQLEEEGWLKVCQGDMCLINRTYDFMYTSKIRMTDAQWKIVEDWCLKHNREIPDRDELDAGR